jgi:hypothetical protein
MCRALLTEGATEIDPAIVTGMEAHIVSAKPHGPRYRPLGPDEIDDPENFIILCPTHHAVVDKQESHYDEIELRRIKREHEERVRTVLGRPDRVALYSSDPGDLLVEVVSELPHRLSVGLLILEVRVRVHNQTAGPKSFDFMYSHAAGESLIASKDETQQSIESVRLQSPPLAPHTVIDGGEQVVGWIVIYIPHSPPGIPPYEVTAIDESGTTYAVRVPKH